MLCSSAKLCPPRRATTYGSPVRPNGNTPPGRVRRQSIRLAMTRAASGVTPGTTITCRMLARNMLTRRARSCQTHGAYTTYTATLRSGATTGIVRVTTTYHLRLIRLVRRPVRAVSCAAGRGYSICRSAAPRIASGTRLASATTSSGFGVLRGLRNAVSLDALALCLLTLTVFPSRPKGPRSAQEWPGRGGTF